MSEFIGSGVNTLYVDGENGNDGNSGSASHSGTTGAWKSIPYALTQIDSGSIPQDGDELRIMKTSDDATYYGVTGSLDVSWSSKEVSIVGANSSGTVDGTVVEINGGNLDSSTPIMLISGSDNDNCSFSNLSFNCGGTAQHGVEATGSGNNGLSWINCRFTNATSHGLYTTSLPNYWQFINCRFDNNGGNGLDHYGSQFGMTYKCLMDNNTGDGYKCGANSRVAECIMYNNGGYGLNINDAGSIICNCIIDSNGSTGVKVWGGWTSRFVDNVITNNAGVGLSIASASAESVHFNTSFDNNSSAHNSQNHLILYDFDSAGTVSYEDASGLDFTPTSTSSVIGKGFPTHFKWFGSTGGDAGVGKFVQEGGESISIF